MGSLISCSRIALLLVVWFVSFLAVIPVDVSSGIGLSDKILHAMAFAVLMLLIDFSWPQTGLTVTKFAAVVAYGVLIEAVQYFIPYRDASIVDILADVAGMAVYPMLVPVLQIIPMLKRRWSLV